MRKACGIYKITCTFNGKIYIGQTSLFGKRKHEHFSALAHNRHENKSMQADWNEYRGYFRFDIVKRCPLEELNYWEKFYIDLWDTENPIKGYNRGWAPVKRKGVKSIDADTRHKRKRKK